MSTPGLRARNKARTRDEILGAALDLFESNGFDATTCEEIAAAADVSPRTFFRYFETKHDILGAGRRDEEGPLAVIAEVTARPASESPVEVVRHALRLPIGVLEAQRDLLVRQYRVMMSTPSLESWRTERFTMFEPPLAAALAARLGHQPDDLPIRLLAAATGATLRLSIEQWVSSGAEPGTLHAVVDEALALVADGFDAL